MADASDRARVCVLGSINVDLVVRSARLPRAGETIIGGEFDSHPGGKGANQAVAAARMGAAVTFIGAVGEDAHGRMMLDVLGREGIDVSRIAVRASAPTGTALITVAADGENTIVVASGANATVSKEDVDAARAAIADADVLLMQLETPLDACRHAAQIAADSGVTVLLNAAPALAAPADLLAAVDLLLVNRTEGEAIGAGRIESPLNGALPDDLKPLAARLAAIGIERTVMTLGAAGAAVIHERAAAMVESFTVTPVDTVGAGDAFAGVLACRWAEHKIGGGLDAAAVHDALCWASAAGALATTKRGAIPSLPTRAEVVAMLRSQGACA